MDIQFDNIHNLILIYIIQHNTVTLLGIAAYYPYSITMYICVYIIVIYT